jgi:Spy/CpxP family protein refolding chaperone
MEARMRNGSRWLGALAGVLALAIATPALAQDEAPGESQTEARVHERHHGEGGHDVEKRIEHLREALELSDAQVTQMRGIFAEHSEKFRELKEAEDRDALHALREELHDRFAAVLTETQREKLATLRREHHGDGQHREQEGKGRDHEGHDEVES